MEGYEPPHFAPGYSWRDEVVPDKCYELKAILWGEFIPDEDDGIPLFGL